MKFTTIFSSTVKPLVSEEKDKYLALASLIEVGNFIPNIDTEKNVDLLPLAFNACVANRVNKNGDVIDSKTAVEICQSFINKPINVEHNRQNVVGVILAAGYSEFGSDLPLTEEQVREMKGPFNITLGGVVWKLVNEKLASVIEDSNDPTSESFLKVSASWELGFDDYSLILLEGSEKNIESGMEITDASEIEALLPSLRSFGGSGRTKEGYSVYRKVTGGVLALGIGLTENPAADVIGVSVKTSEEILENVEPTDNNISQNSIIDVNIKREKVMKIANISEITEESLKTVTASAVAEFISEELKKASDKYEAEKSEKDNAIQAANEKCEALSNEYNTIKQELDKLKSVVSEMEASKHAMEKENKFNEHMSELDNMYAMHDELKSVIANQLKNLMEGGDEGVAAWKNGLSVMMKPYTRVKDSAATVVAEVKAEVQASESATSIVDEAIDKAEKEIDAVPNTSSASESSLFDKYKKAFSAENFEIKF